MGVSVDLHRGEMQYAQMQLFEIVRFIRLFPFAKIDNNSLFGCTSSVSPDKYRGIEQVRGGSCVLHPPHKRTCKFPRTLIKRFHNSPGAATQE